MMQCRGCDTNMHVENRPQDLYDHLGMEPLDNSAAIHHQRQIRTPKQAKQCIDHYLLECGVDERHLTSILIAERQPLTARAITNAKKAPQYLKHIAEQLRAESNADGAQ